MIRFGTGGWRAIIGDEFTKENVQKVSQALANIIHEDKVADSGFVVGFDRRFLSDKASRWMAEVSQQTVYESALSLSLFQPLL